MTHELPDHLTQDARDIAAAFGVAAEIHPQDYIFQFVLKGAASDTAAAQDYYEGGGVAGGVALVVVPDGLLLDGDGGDVAEGVAAVVGALQVGEEREGGVAVVHDGLLHVADGASDLGVVDYGMRHHFFSSALTSSYQFPFAREKSCAASLEQRLGDLCTYKCARYV